MYIKSNEIVKAVCVFAAVGIQAFDYDANIAVGMQTNRQQMAITAMHSHYDSDYIESRIELSHSLGYLVPEFIDVNVFADIPVVDSLYFRPFVTARFLSLQGDLGVALAYKVELYEKAAKLTTALSSYRKFYYDDVTYKNQYAFDVDYALRLDIPLNQYVEMYTQISQPLILNHDLVKDDNVFSIMNRSSFSFGVSFHLLADIGDIFSDNSVDSKRIIQEPIAIPVIDLVIEEPEEEQYIEPMDEIKVVELKTEEEPLGWFAWIIEFIASLFRF